MDLLSFFAFSVWLSKWPPTVTWLFSLLLVQMKVYKLATFCENFTAIGRIVLEILCVEPIYPQYSEVFETCLALRYWFFVNHLLGKGWPLGSCLWCLTESLLLSDWYPGSGVVLDCIDSWSLHPYLFWGAW